MWTRSIQVDKFYGSRNSNCPVYFQNVYFTQMFCIDTITMAHFYNTTLVGHLIAAMMWDSVKSMNCVTEKHRQYLAQMCVTNSAKFQN
jgi:hypothetical protein